MNLLKAVACTFLLTIPNLAPAAAPVKIVSVEPSLVCFWRGQDPYLLKQQQPLRAMVRLHNLSPQKQECVLAAEVVGNLDTVYGLPNQNVTLAPNEEKLVWIFWAYPMTVSYPDISITIPAPSWGHELKLVLENSNGTVIDRASTAFAIEHDGLKHEGKPQKEWPKLSGREAFELRYCGYLRNPAFATADVSPELKFDIGGTKATKMARGTVPCGLTSYLYNVLPAATNRNASLIFAANNIRLRQAWLFEPQKQKALQLYHLVDGKEFKFVIPPTDSNAVLVMEVEPWRYKPPVSIPELAAEGDKKFGPFHSLIQDTDSKAVTDLARWQEVREKIRAKIWRALYVKPEPKTTPLSPVLISSEYVCQQAHREQGVSRAYTRQKVSIQTRAGQRMNVWLLIPQGIGPFPAVIALHQTVDEGKDEPVGLGGSYWRLHFAPFLASRGYVVLCPDSPTVGERYDPDKRGAWDTSAEVAKDPRWSLAGERIVEQMRCIDYLETLGCVDKSRIGAIGHSLGGEMTSFLMAMDDRIRAGVESCGFTMVQTLEDAVNTYTLPNWAEFPLASFKKPLQDPPGKRTLPFDFDDIMALWAPRPMFMNDVRNEPDNWTSQRQTEQAMIQEQQLYKFLGASEKFYPYVIESTHDFNPDVQPAAFDWLDYWLKGSASAVK